MKNRKSGVAVIIVLGLLGLLMILGVAFSITMRVERAGAANYATAVRTRQMVWAGLATAIGDINSSISSNMYPDGDFLVSTTSGTASWGHSSTNKGAVRLLRCGITDSLPGLFSETNITLLKSDWRPIGESSANPDGYIAYAVVNLSDMLDLNHVGGEPRAAGTNAAELVLSGLGVDGVALKAARANAGPFETLADFKNLYPTISTDYLVEYSRFLPDTNAVDPVDIGGDDAALTANKTEIKRKLRDVISAGRTNIRIGNQELEWLFGCMLDYIGTNSVPNNSPDGPSANCVPMLNEVAVPQFRILPDRVQSVVKLESWYPFFNPSGGHFQLLANLYATISVGTNSVSVTTQMVGVVFSPDPDGAPQFDTFGWRIPIVDDPPNPYDINIKVENLRMVDPNNGFVVDSATNSLNFTYNGRPAVNATMIPLSYQVKDPRINWRPTDWVDKPNDTIGSLNDGVLSSYRMLHSGRGQFISPLELGFIVYPEQDRSNPGAETWEAWRTFRALKDDSVVPQRHELLRHFTTEANPDPKSPKRGLVNMNSISPEIIETAFAGMQNPYDGGPIVGTNVLGAISTLVASSGTFFKSIDDLLALDWRPVLEGLGLSDVELEALAAFSVGLMGVRQNLFLIVVAANGASQGMHDEKDFTVDLQGSQRAMALVWRDPVPNSAGLYDCFIQMMKWLD